jgi:hypothetical protein
VAEEHRADKKMTEAPKVRKPVGGIDRLLGKAAISLAIWIFRDPAALILVLLAIGCAVVAVYFFDL